MCRYDIRGTTHETLSYGEIMDRISEFLHSDISNNTGSNNCGANKIVGTNRVNTLKTQCNITKDINHTPGFTPGYQIYYRDSSLFSLLYSAISWPLLS